MNIYRILDEDNQLFRIVKCKYERDRLLALDKRFKYDTIVCKKNFNKRENSYEWAYKRVGECLL